MELDTIIIVGLVWMFASLISEIIAIPLRLYELHELREYNKWLDGEVRLVEHNHYYGVDVIDDKDDKDA